MIHVTGWLSLLSTSICFCNWVHKKLSNLCWQEENQMYIIPPKFRMNFTSVQIFTYQLKIAGATAQQKRWRNPDSCLFSLITKLSGIAFHIILLLLTRSQLFDHSGAHMWLIISTQGLLAQDVTSWSAEQRWGRATSRGSGCSHPPPL